MKAGGNSYYEEWQGSPGNVVDYFQRNKLCLLLSDKEEDSWSGTGDYNTRATEAIRKNFEALRPSEHQGEVQTAVLCRDLELSS
ncbi:hypothetical protein HPB50_005305 [Hyalomma asiaticum]|uniref:Uncharacterized protein n=1 Tax=Hyalomma asiaticum TaxID=266040 RepID=A0ACB7RPH5_HYAAI|nr:hypothetical protein HPB50_005305 [Hyalomma asiaticum]